jgi:hypothetical protein
MDIYGRRPKLDLFYMLNHWSTLSRYLDEGFVKPDNNKAEQHIQSIALGRKIIYPSARIAVVM